MSVEEKDEQTVGTQEGSKNDDNSDNEMLIADVYIKSAKELVSKLSDPCGKSLMNWLVVVLLIINHIILIKLVEI